LGWISDNLGVAAALTIGIVAMLVAQTTNWKLVGQVRREA